MCIRDSIITDVEFKFLIDSVLYSNIFNNERALDLAGRIQTLSGKNLKDITPYANDSFGRTRYAQNTDVLANCQLIIDAIKNDNYIEFDWNVYDVKNKNVYLHFQGRRTVIPIRLMLDVYKRQDASFYKLFNMSHGNLFRLLF